MSNPSDPLTKTPSADHDDGNLRGLAAPNEQQHIIPVLGAESASGAHVAGRTGCANRPTGANHQPHAVSQGWREARPSIPSDGFNCIYLYEGGREVGCLNGPQDDPAVISRANNWVGSPPSPAKTGGAS